MRDILQTISDKEARIAALEQEIAVEHEDVAALKRAALILEADPDGLIPVSKGVTAKPKKKASGGPNKYAVAVGDAAETVLINAGIPMHVRDITTAIENLYNINPSWISVDSAMRKDKKKRFALLSKRVYELTQKSLPAEGEPIKKALAL